MGCEWTLKADTVLLVWYFTLIRFHDWLTDGPVIARCCMSLKQDWAPSHYWRSVRDHVVLSFLNKWIGRVGSFICLPLSPLKFLPWDTMKSLLYETPWNSKLDMVENISIAAAIMREKPGTFQYLHHSMSRPSVCACTLAHGCNFEHLQRCFNVMLLFY